MQFCMPAQHVERQEALQKKSYHSDLISQSFAARELWCFILISRPPSTNASTKTLHFGLNSFSPTFFLAFFKVFQHNLFSESVPLTSVHASDNVYFDILLFFWDTISHQQHRSKTIGTICPNSLSYKKLQNKYLRFRMVG